MIVYKITNSINGKVYIGQTINKLSSRFNDHCNGNGHCLGISGAIKKYGKEKFKIEEIGGANSQEELNYQEWLLIHLHNTISPNGYNLREGGNNSRHSKQSKKNISKAQKKRFKDPKELEKHTERGIKQWSDPKSRKEMSNIKKKFYKNNPKVLDEMSKNTKKRCENPEFKLKMSISHGGKPFQVFKITKDNGKSTLNKQYEIFETELIGEWQSQEMCAKELILRKTCIWACLHGNQKLHKGYVFQFIKR